MFRTCAASSCSRQPSFGLITDGKATFCKQHAGDDMVDIRSKRCAASSCSRQPYFGLITDGKPTFCKQHAGDGMVDVRNKRCAASSCSRQPCFGLITDGKPTVCSQHQGHLSGGEAFNFKLTCEVTGCGKVARFGQEGGRPTHCNQHGLQADGFICLVGSSRRKRASSCSRSTSRNAAAEKNEHPTKRAREAIPWAPVPAGTASSAVGGSGESVVVADGTAKKQRDIIWI